MSYSQKKHAIKMLNLEASATPKKQLKSVDPVQLVRMDYNRNKISDFVANDLIRIYEVMDESKGNVNKLEMKNRKRIQHFNEILNLKNREKPLQLSDFETYERKKRRVFSWQQPAQTSTASASAAPKDNASSQSGS